MAIPDLFFIELVKVPAFDARVFAMQFSLSF
jgi:hypothetical protein